jgi:porin
MNLGHCFSNCYCFVSLGFLSLIALDIPALATATMSEPATINSEEILATEATSTAANPAAQIEEITLTTTPESTLTTSSLVAQAILEDIDTPDELTEPTVTLEDQVTSVSQLTDVQPSDWAFEALRSLVERYGAIAGYPDGTFRGNRAMTRYEFAAALNAALDRINELIGTGSGDRVSRDDLVTLQRLQQEFATELATLRGRVDGLEVRTAELETTQFSTTTKLTGQVIFAVNGGGFDGDSIISPTGQQIANDDPNITTLFRASIDFDTSFFGTDLLKIRVDTGSDAGSDNAAGFLEPNLGSVLDFSVKPPRDREFGIGRLYYTFKPFQNFTVSLGPDIRTTDYVDRNSYANLSFRDFSTQALINNYILFPINGPSAGAAIDWKPGGGAFTVRALYAAPEASNPGDRGFIRGVSSFTRLLYPTGGGELGLFGDSYQGTVELEYSPSRTLALRLQYSGGSVFDNGFDAFGANVELTLSPQFAVFGRYGYGSYDDTAFGDINPNYWMAGIAFPDLLVPGALAGIAAGQPFIESDVGNATQTNFEAFYKFPVTKNIQVTPLLQIITNSSNQDSNGTVFTGTLRTVFFF